MENRQPMPTYAGIKETSRLTGLSLYALRKRAAEGKAPFILNGKRRLYNVEELLRMLNAESTSMITE